MPEHFNLAHRDKEIDIAVILTEGII